MKRILTTIFFLLLLVCSSLLYAAQDGIVISESATIHETPSETAPIVEEVKKGLKLRISSETKLGWFKTRGTNGQFGWILQNQISTVSKTESQDNSLQLKETKRVSNRRTHDEPKFVFRFGGLGLGIFNADYSQSVGLSKSHLYFGPGAFLELGYRIQEKLRLGLRGAYYRTSGSATYDATQFGTQTVVTRNYDFSFSGMPLLVGVEGTLLQYKKLELMFAGYGGLNIATSGTVTATGQDSPNSMTLSGTAAAFQINLNGKYSFSPGFGAVLELGYFYSQLPSSATTERFNGEDAFLSSSTGLPAKLRVASSGPVIGLGLEFIF